MLIVSRVYDIQDVVRHNLCVRSVSVVHRADSPSWTPRLKMGVPRGRGASSPHGNWVTSF